MTYTSHLRKRNANFCIRNFLNYIKLDLNKQYRVDDYKTGNCAKIMGSFDDIKVLRSV